MLASFTSMLPSGIGFSSTKDDAKDKSGKESESLPSSSVTDQRTGEDAENSAKTKDAAVEGINIRRKKERAPNETFIVVRPPPSMSNHPLNLQVQLVPPQAKDRAVSASSNRRSIDFTNAQEDSTLEQGAPLARTTSIRSNRSDISSFYASQSSSSMTSISSYASTASGVGGRRMIVPLYNLSAHNVMTNTVLDAGTDAKIAKFHKRSLDILGILVLEPFEVWPSAGHSNSGLGKRGSINKANNSSPRSDLRRIGSMESDALRGAHADQLTPTSSALSLSSAGDNHYHPQDIPETPTTATEPAFGLSPTPTQSSAKKIFGRIFKKKDGGGSASGGESTPPSRNSRGPLGGMLAPPASPSSRLSFGVRSNRSAESVPVPTAPTTPKLSSSSSTRVRRSLGVSASSTDSPSGNSHQPILQPAILGIQPILFSPCNPPVGRPTKYVWVVKKWLKGSEGGILGGVMKGVNVGVGVIAGVAANVSSASSGNGGGNNGSGFGAKALNFAGNKGSGIGEGLEVRFEWVRGTPKSHKRRSTAPGRRTSTALSSSQTSLNGGSGHVQSASTPAGTAGSRKSLGERAVRSSTGGVSNRRSLESHRSASPTHLTSSGSRRRTATGPSNRDSRTNSMVSTNASEEQHGEGGDKLTTSPKPSFMGESEHDDGEDSDPEDSETPWTCALIISTTPFSSSEPDRLRQSHATTRPTSSLQGQGFDSAQSTSEMRSMASSGSLAAGASPERPSRASSATAPGTVLRLKIATLAPAPHHPKVVAQFKVPFPLPDVDVARGVAIKRPMSPSGGLARPPESDDGLILTGEEIKDIVSSTGFWLVVREGFGGVGKVNRKGDGWRIRG